MLQLRQLSYRINPCRASFPATEFALDARIHRNPFITEANQTNQIISLTDSHMQIHVTVIDPRDITVPWLGFAKIDGKCLYKANKEEEKRFVF